MLIAKKYFAVNWVDGMKLTQQHFLDTDLHVADLVRDTASLFLTRYNFGLLPPVHGTRLFSEIQLLDKVGNSVVVRVSRCNAITAGGCRIAINPETRDSEGNHLATSLPVDDAVAEADRPNYYAILTVHPFKQVPVGPLDPDESPVRHPFSDARYKLEVVQTDRIKAEELGPYVLIIGRIIFHDGRYLVDKDFIPPCTCMESHPRLLEYQADFDGRLNALQRDSFAIVRRIHAQPQPSSIARNVRELCLRMADYLGQILFNYRNLGSQHPPVYLLDYFNNLTSIILTALYCMPAREKEELLHYFYEWTAVTPNSFEELLRNLVELDYRHQDIGASMQHVDRFLTVMEGLWAKLSRLEYIGQRKDNILVQEEHVRRPGPAAEPGRRWSIVD